MHWLALVAVLPLALGAVVSSATATRDEPSESDDGGIVSGKYIVTLDDDADMPMLASILSRLNGEPDYIYDMVFKGFAKALDETEMGFLRSHQHVNSIREDRVVSGFGMVEQQSAFWGLGRISNKTRGATSYVYDESAGNGTCAYVLDTGVDDTHPDFGVRAGVRAQQLISFIAGQERDGNGHGTHAAGIIGGATYGVAKQTKIFGVKILDDALFGTESKTIAGMNFVATDKAGRDCPNGVVVNLSSGSIKSTEVNRAAAALIASGVFLGVAAGNSNRDAADYSPGSEPGACVVGGTDADDKLFHVRPSFASNYGPRVDILAPGRRIRSTDLNGGWSNRTGTSSAAPYVVGLAAYLGALEGLSGSRVLCDRMRQLATRDAIVDLRNDTVNLLAFNGAT